MPNPKDITGLKSGRLTAIRRYGRKNSSYEYYWECSCDCGKKAFACISSLTSGRAKSCGCLHKLPKNKTHGMTGTKVYLAWISMKNRCYDKNNASYYSHGQRGIKVCDRWSSFENFYKDMGNPPTKKHSLDRINNNGDYEPKNCRWATMTEQHRNKNNNLILEYKGTRGTIAQLCEIFGKDYSLVKKRYWTCKWDIKRAMELPRRIRRWGVKPKTRSHQGI